MNSSNPYELKRTNVMAEFSIIGDTFSLETITNELGILPSITRVKGDKIRNTDMVHNETCWEWNTGYEESLEVDNQISQIIGKFECKLDRLDALKVRFDLEYKLSVVINVQNDEKPAIYLSRETVKFISRIESDFDCDLYIY